MPDVLQETVYDNALWYSLIGEKAFLSPLVTGRTHLSHSAWVYSREIN